MARSINSATVSVCPGAAHLGLQLIRISCVLCAAHLGADVYDVQQVGVDDAAAADVLAAQRDEALAARLVHVPTAHVQHQQTAAAQQVRVQLPANGVRSGHYSDTGSSQVS